MRESQKIERLRLPFSSLVPVAFGEPPEFNPADGIDFWERTNRQDSHICEQSQLGIGSPFYRPGPYSHREALSMQFDREVLRQLGHPRHY